MYDVILDHRSQHDMLRDIVAQLSRRHDDIDLPTDADLAPQAAAVRSSAARRLAASLPAPTLASPHGPLRSMKPGVR